MGYLQNRSLKKCEQCGLDMHLRYSSKFKSYFLGCSGYPKCRNTEHILVGELSTLVNHLLLYREYLDEIIENITTNEAIQRGDYNAIDSLVQFAYEAQEHIRQEQKAYRKLYDKIAIQQ